MRQAILSILVSTSLLAAPLSARAQTTETPLYREQIRVYGLELELEMLENTYAVLTGEKTYRPFLSLEEMVDLDREVDANILLDAVMYYGIQLEDQIRLLRYNIALYGDKLIHIDLGDQHAYLIDDANVVADFPVSSGTEETPTPRGKFQVYRKQELRISSQEIQYRMPNYLSFTRSGSHGIHALPYLGGDSAESALWHEARSNIGRPASHGCVRLLPEDSAIVFDWAEVGTPIYITN